MSEQPKPTTKAEAPKKEATTVPAPKSGFAKWAGRIGKFLMYGGWILVVALALGITILVSILTK